MDALWQIELLGWLRATQGERIVTRFSSNKAGALLGYLSYHRHRSHPREALIELLWPECDPETGRRRLRKALSSLRRQLGPPAGANRDSGEILLADRATVQLKPACDTDVARFEAILQAASRAGGPTERVRSLVEAVELYRGPLLPGYYEEWIIPERQRLEERFSQALRQLILAFEQAGDLDRAVQYAHRAVSADPLREEAHHELIRLYAAAGHRRAALRQYGELERILARDLHTTPAPATCTLVQGIRSQRDSAIRAEGERQSGSELRPGREEPASSDDLYCDFASPALTAGDLEPVGGAMPLDSPFYVVRPTDHELAAAIDRQDSIVLVKGTREVGKSSLLIRGLHRARRTGARVVLTDLQGLNAADLETAEPLLLALAQSIADALNLDVAPSDVWDARRGSNLNFRRYLIREVLGTLSAPLVWGLDQVDRLFARDPGSELFGLFRSWYNERALDPAGPWSRLTLVMSYATEAHLFITDADQSPFNVGTRLTLDDFTRDQVAELNRRYGGPLKEAAEVERFYFLVSGHPYLVRRGLHEMATQGVDITASEARAPSEEWIYGHHLRRVRALLARDKELCDGMRAVLQGQSIPNLDSFYRLRSAGIISGESVREARPRCQLYATYLERHLM
jgi:DNA-binding SARP family transcriptional activator